ncbi:heme exporter protein D [Novimethylophilus kurashikiensis]|uniref:Heme exporter protein D n=1 Tax=Novimethylophilus kurashikiensis TaxID=1825523 RepID=A0A2R5F7N7_9PROT|nr:heme exporter protein CcmD [Novimethylophilus kurashikiensis]GBG12923.1 heme exporter protein D [Novimethylophilus kurashikiensis]
MMHWNSTGEFFAMGGYGFYVWVSYGLTALCLAGELWMLHSRRRRIERAGDEA